MISVIVCTWNRSGILLRCLQSLERQTLDKGGHEAVVVDNNSTDDTARVVAEFARASDMSIQYVCETRQGLSHARNAGIAAARGELLAFLDDDCVAEPGFLAGLLSAFNETGADLVAGKLASVPPDDLVTDLPRGFDACRKLAHLDFGPEPRPLLSHESALGGNLAVRKATAQRVGGFRSDLGYSGESKTVGEDTEFCARVALTGAKLVWEPRAAVIHCVGPERFSKTAYRRAAYYYAQGSIKRRLGEHPSVTRRARAVGKSLLQGVFNGLRWLLVCWSPRLRFEAELKMAQAAGKVGAALDKRGGEANG